MNHYWNELTCDWVITQLQFRNKSTSERIFEIHNGTIWIPSIPPASLLPKCLDGTFKTMCYIHLNITKATPLIYSYFLHQNMGHYHSFSQQSSKNDFSENVGFFNNCLEQSIWKKSAHQRFLVHFKQLRSWLLNFKSLHSKLSYLVLAPAVGSQC